MKLTEKEQWLFAAGIWLGLGVVMISFGIAVYIFPEEQYPIIYSIFMGILFCIVAKSAYNRYFNYEGNA